MDKVLSIAIEAAVEAGKIILGYYSKEKIFFEKRLMDLHLHMQIKNHIKKFV